MGSTYRKVSLVLSTTDLQLIPHMTICIVRRRRLQLDSISGQVNVASRAATVRLLQIAFFVFNRHAGSVTAANPFLLVCMSLCLFPLFGHFFSSFRVLYVYFLVPSFIC